MDTDMPTDTTDADFGTNDLLQKLVDIHSQIQALRQECKLLTSTHLTPLRAHLKEVQADWDVQAPLVIKALNDRGISLAVLNRGDAGVFNIRVMAAKAPTTIKIKELEQDLRRVLDDVAGEQAYTAILDRHPKFKDKRFRADVRRKRQSDGVGQQGV
jgi:pullulanase/glycogen debranching enzyme